MSRSFQIRFDFVSVCSSISGLAVGFSVSDLLVLQTAFSVNIGRKPARGSGQRLQAGSRRLCRWRIHAINETADDDTKWRRPYGAWQLSVTSWSQKCLCKKFGPLITRPDDTSTRVYDPELAVVNISIHIPILTCARTNELDVCRCKNLACTSYELIFHVHQF